MQASVMRIDEFIADKRTLVIPVYQRNYDWKTANCEQLFDDLEIIAQNGKEHFIGTFVYQYKPAAGIFQEFIIIDGQQRITSIILFAKALYDLTDDDSLKDDIYSTFLKHGKGAFKGKCKLRPTEYDCATFEKLLRPSDNVENFLVQYLITKRKTDTVTETKRQRLSSRNLYGVFKDYFARNFANAEACLTDLYRYAKFFRRFIFDDDTKFYKLSALDKKFYELVYLLEADNAPIILMYLLDRYEQNHFDEATFIKFVDALISLVFRAKVCGNTGITSQFAGNVLARLDKENCLGEKVFWRIITFGKGRYAFPNDKDFQAALVTNSLYKTIKSNGCKYLLYSLERASRLKELPTYSEATVEHILPQKLNDTWKEHLRGRNDFSAHEIWLHTLGNLTLTAYNSELSNADFDSKKKIYEQSNFSYTRALKDSSEWTSRQIQKRAQKLAAEAIKIWILPEEFNSHFLNVGDTFNLDSDFDLFKGKEPERLFISGAEMKMPYWNWLLREIVKQLYALDSDIFRQAASVRDNLFTTEPTDFKLDENFYMKTGFDTKNCLRIAKVLVENFDHLGETNFKEDIQFTLRK